MLELDKEQDMVIVSDGLGCVLDVLAYNVLDSCEVNA